MKIYEKLFVFGLLLLHRQVSCVMGSILDDELLDMSTLELPHWFDSVSTPSTEIASNLLNSHTMKPDSYSVDDQIMLHALKVSQNVATPVLNVAAWRIVQWKNNLYCIFLSSRTSAIFTVTVSSSNIYFDEFQKLPSTVPLYLQTVDILEVIVVDDVMWIFVASYNSNLVLVIRLALQFSQRMAAIHQIIPTDGFISGITTFYLNGSIYLFTVMNSTKLHPSQEPSSQLYMKKDELFDHLQKVDFKTKGGSRSVQTFHHLKTIYTLVLEEVGGGVLFAFNADAKSMNLIHEFAINSISFTTYSSIQGDDRHIVELRKDGRLESFRLTGAKLESINTIVLTSFNPMASYRITSTRIGNANLLMLADEGSIHIYEEMQNHGFIKKISFSNSCRRMHHFYLESFQEGVLIITDCGTMGQSFTFLESKPEDGLMYQRDLPISPYSSLSNIEKCLEELDTTIKRNRPFITYLTVSITTADSDEGLSAGFTNFNNEDFEVKDIPDELNNLHTQISSLNKMIITYRTHMKYVEAELPSLLTFGSDQHISASIKSSKLTTNSSNVFALEVEKLNGIEISDYKEKYLRLEDDQEITTNIIADKIISVNLFTNALFSDVIKLAPQDFLDLRNPNQVVSGHHSFSSIGILGDVRRTNTKRPLLLNGIPTDQLITSTWEVSLYDIKTFSKPVQVTQSVSLDILNGEAYEHWKKSLLYLTGGSMVSLTSSIVIQGNVHVKGNVAVKSVNGININEFAEKVARKSRKYQIISGPVEFVNLKMSTMEVKEVNDVAWSDYLRKENSTVHANFFVDEGVVVGDLSTDSINGVDFEKDILLTDTDQVIEGQIDFLSDVDVTGPDGVTMNVGVTINGIDPSLRFPFSTGLNHQVVNKELNIGEVLKAKGSVQIGFVNGAQFPDLKNGFWRKSISQKIPNDVTIRNTHFKKEVYASSLNGLKLDEYLQTELQQTLTGRNYFITMVEVMKNLELDEGRTLDGVKVSELHDNAILLKGRQTIYGTSVFSEGLHVNDLTIKVLKGIDIDEDLVYANSSIILDRASFTDMVSAKSLISKGSLEVKSINDNQPNRILKPKANPLSEIQGNLIIRDLEAKDLMVNGKFCGVDFNKWIKQVVDTESFSSQSFVKKVVVNGTVTFRGPVELEYVNNKEWNVHLQKIAQVCQNCRIKGMKTFTRPLYVYGNVTADYINGIDLNLLRNRILLRSTPQKIASKYTFENGISADELEVPEISGYQIDDLAVIDRPTSLKGPVVSTSVIHIDELKANHSWLDGCNINAVLNPPKIKAGDLIFSDIFLGHLRVKGNVTVEHDAFCGYGNLNVLSFLKRVVRSSKQQTVTGETHFQGKVIIHNLKTNYTNDLTVGVFFDKLLKKQTYQELNCSVNFTDTLQVNNMTVADIIPILADMTINDLSLHGIKRLGVKRGSNDFISGKKSVLTLYGNDLKVRKMNEMTFSNFVKLNDKNYGKGLKFLQHLTIGRDITVNGLIAQMQPSEIFKPFESTQNDSSPSIFPPRYNLLEIKGDLLVDSINGISLQNLVTKTGSSQVIIGEKTILGGIYADGEVHIDKINNIDLDQFERWSQFHLQSSPEENFEIALVEDKKQQMNDVMRRAYLEKTAFRLRRLNEFNYHMAQNLHQELTHLREKSRIASPKSISRVLSFQDIQGVSHIFALASNSDGCVEAGMCADEAICSSTVGFTVDEERGLEKQSSMWSGLRFVMYIAETGNDIYDFVTPCWNDKSTATSIRKLSLRKKKLYYKLMELGDVLKISPFTLQSKVYFVAISRFYVSKRIYTYEIIVLKAVDSVDIVWRSNLNIKAVDFDLLKIKDGWLLAIAGERDNYDKAMQSESQIYSWNSDRKKFMLVAQLEPSSKVKFLAMGEKSWLVMLSKAMDFSSQLVPEESLDHAVIYSKEYNSSGFRPFRSIQMDHISDLEPFVVGSDFFIAVASHSEGSIRIFKLVKFEGFQAVKSFSVENPTSLLYFNFGKVHYLAVTSSSDMVLLKLQFEGVAGTSIADPFL